MFLCANCHNPEHVHFSYSFGPCEGCRVTAECVDCHSNDPWNHTGVLKKIRKPMAKPSKIIKSKKGKRLEKIRKKEENDERSQS